jgi:hypothetical protein
MGRVPPSRVRLPQMTARQPPEEPTRPIPRGRPIAAEREIVGPAPDQTLWAEVLDRLSSLRAGLVVVAVLALAALGIALWVLLDDAGETDRGDASRARVERLEDRVDSLESQVGESASRGGVAAIRDGQQALQQRVQALEGAVEDAQAAGEGVDEVAAAVEGLQDSVDALEQRVEAVEQQQP